MRSKIQHCLIDPSLSVISAQGNTLKRNLKVLLTAGLLTLMPAIGHSNSILPPDIMYSQAAEQTDFFQKSLSPILIPSNEIHFLNSTDDFLKIPRINQIITKRTEYAPLTGEVDRQCYTTTPHPDETILSKTIDFAYKSLTVNGFLFKTDAFWLMNYHEEAHCGQYLFINGDHASLASAMLKEALGYKPKAKQLEIFTGSMQEALSDVYAVLEVQFNYMKNNQALIENGKIPPLNPAIYNLLLYRDALTNDHLTHKTSNMMADALLKVLSNPENLLMSSKKDRFLSAMLITANHLPELGIRAGIDANAAEKIHYPNNFLLKDPRSALETQMLASGPNHPFTELMSQQGDGVKGYILNLLASKEKKLLAEPESEQTKLRLHLLKSSQQEISYKSQPLAPLAASSPHQPNFQVNFLDFMAKKENSDPLNTLKEQDVNKIPNEIKVEDIVTTHIKF